MVFMLERLCCRFWLIKMEKNKLIGKIENGIVIDHIPKGKVWEVVNILKLDFGNVKISLSDVCESDKLKEGKGIIKIENFYPSARDLDVISVVAPNATVTTINSGKVVSKRKVILPKVLNGIVFCANSNCISNQEREKVGSVIYSEGGEFVCHYCRHVFGKEDLRVRG